MSWCIESFEELDNDPWSYYITNENCTRKPGVCETDMSETEAGLEQFLPAVETRYTLAVINRTASQPFQTMLEGVFENQPVAVEEQLDPNRPNDTIALLEDGTVVAESPLGVLSDAILMVNSDLYTTGTRKVETTEAPAVIEKLTEVPFRVRGYPDSNSEKLLFIVISRYIERLAYTHGRGTLRTGFQELSRIRDEAGTRDVYAKLSETDVDVHIYGVPNGMSVDERPASGESVDELPDSGESVDEFPGDELQVVTHSGYTPDIENTWFVVFDPHSKEERAAALLAFQRGANTWEGFWTYELTHVEAIAEYIRQKL